MVLSSKFKANGVPLAYSYRKTVRMVGLCCVSISGTMTLILHVLFSDINMCFAMTLPYLSLSKLNLRFLTPPFSLQLLVSVESIIQITKKC